MSQSDSFLESVGSKSAAMQLGNLRKRQEDSVAIGETFAVLADGMGGQPDGDLASRTAVASAVAAMDSPMSGIFEAAQRSVSDLHETGRYGSSPHRWPMTTLIVAKILAGWVSIGHIGDSRVYVYRDGELRQVTVDHEDGQGRITRAIGFGDHSPDVHVIRYGRLLLATDGLWLDLSEEEITELMASDLSDEVVADNLARGAAEIGRDNTSVVVWSI